MKFSISTSQTINSIMRLIGYRAAFFQNEGENSLVRPLGRNDYPRFHLYIKEANQAGYVFNLHLDQKKPSYQGSAGHSGEYEGDLVEGEAARIKSILGAK